MNAPLFDTHCHLDHEKFAGDLPEVLRAAKAVGMWRMATIGCAKGPEDMPKALSIAHAHDWIVATVGVHPHDASAFGGAQELELIETLGADDKVVAIGEMGLDYHYDKSARDLQRTIFRRQIAIARNLGKPIVVHSRSAREDTLQILKEENAAAVGGIIHCFSEDRAFADAALEMGLLASFSGIVTFPSAKAIQEAAKYQPADMILVETDAPYLAPVPLRGKRNEPAFTAHTLEFVAGLRGDTVDGLRLQTSQNAARLFGLEAPPEWVSSEESLDDHVRHQETV